MPGEPFFIYTFITGSYVTIVRWSGMVATENRVSVVEHA